MKNYGSLVVGLISVWFIVALSASALHLFKNPANRVGLAVAIAALAPIVAFSLWFAASEKFRQFALSLNPRTLTFLQSSRILGVVFLILQAYGVLPALFARPAGFGDIAIGLTAPLAALWLASSRHRFSFIAWQILGMTDLIVAVSVGATAPLLSPGSTPMVAMTVLPLSLIPTFGVPLYFIFHLICIAQAKSWKVASADALHAAPIRKISAS